MTAAPASNAQGETIAQQVRPLFESFLGEDFSFLITFWDGSTLGDPDAKSSVEFTTVDAFKRIIWSPGELGLSRAFVAGDMRITGDGFHLLSRLLQVRPDASRIGLQTAITSLGHLRKLGTFTKPLDPPAAEAKPAGRRHSKKRDAASISHHYDVGNDFYRMVLGPSMTYSCARFIESSDSLDQAQANKHDLICRKLGLEPGMRLLDVGCGWGSMVMHAARNYGVKAVGITLSEEQAALARERVQEAGLGDSVEIRVQDYRDLGTEKFDAISSVGMFEHVGHKQMSAYFQVLFTALNEGGRLLNHAIDSVGGSFMPRTGFVARYVFPDGELQDLSVSLSAMQEQGFEVRDVESLREHYARTLRLWVSNLEANWSTAVEMVGAERARVWWIYMTGSAVSFEDNSISIHQTLATKNTASGDSGMPLTRSEFV